jgi:hypothetical protein
MLRRMGKQAINKDIPVIPVVKVLVFRTAEISHKKASRLSSRGFILSIQLFIQSH